MANAPRGHIIPEDVIRRRFTTGQNNFKNLYGPKVDSWMLFDNVGAQPLLLDWSENP